ncbi:hypothetical protein PHYPO_G00054300 [Pangasianodon hypophthalmus]|uniref:Reverse transcriptase domain-containing protein n=1 Tax=Pangasianodon hypophthalmus TaxID=310915 RepID=A0A5N5M5T7_PANHP|nr:hypothetical protein PHYPO_G00054300 [Pangasianodon hypophthalmus]
MEEQEIIRKSCIEWASPLVLVWKKSGDLRVCVDYHWLNARTIKDAHPLPHQADCLAALGGNAIFSVMNLTSGFYNTAMAEKDRKFTAFTTLMGLYELNRCRNRDYQIKETNCLYNHTEDKDISSHLTDPRWLRPV